ncbi:hypothetical protein [Vallitalea guaymasensis]|uniref:hypothetical protein n=1 Tax=Vallitalea guaymasensis TaxID=1185412 RepID=UPI0023553178|nr:hypothetical protein [Vallitalea guaymasensis]
MKKIICIVLMLTITIALSSCNKRIEDSINNNLDKNISIENDIETQTDTTVETNLDTDKQEKVKIEPSHFVYTDISIDGFPTELFNSNISFKSLDNKFGELIKAEYFTAFDDVFITTRDYTDFSIDLYLGENKNRTEGFITNIVSLSKTESIVKDIVVGDSMDKVLTTFFNEDNERIDDNYYGDIKILYGDEDLYNKCAYIIYKDDTPSIIKYVGETVVLIFTIDSDNNVSKIEVIETAV